MKLNSQNYVEEAEKVIKSMFKKDRYGNFDMARNGSYRIGITTSKIRNLLAMISAIYNDAMHQQGDTLNTELQSRIQYLRMRFAYEAGREPSVKELVEKGHIFDAIKEIGASKAQLIIFCRYMESLVAYRKYYCGNE